MLIVPLRTIRSAMKEDARIGQPYEERVYAPAAEGGAMLRRSLIEYGSTTAIFTRPSPGTGTYTAFRNLRPQKNVTCGSTQAGML